MALLSKFIHGAFGRLPRIDQDTVVVWEPCSDSHGEIVPGYAQYLLDLGYRVVVLLTPARIDEGLFDRMSDPRLVLGRLAQWRIRRAMRGAAIRQAAGVMITTAGKLPRKADASPDLDRVFGPERPKHVLLVDHDARSRIEAGSWNSDTITLRALDHSTATSRVVNPHYFGQIEETGKSASKTVFVTVGAARAKRRNQNLIYDAARALLARGLNRFEVRMIGKPGAEPVPEDLAGHIKMLGRLPFRDMYDEVEQADFVLTAFQRDNEDHAFYRSTGTTGSFQLCYGFRKPCIVQTRFAALTALDTNNSLFYDADEEMADAMAEAVTMPGDTYDAMRQAMKTSADALYDSSLATMRALLND